ncbi:hypothetical protein AX774_g2105, partial [Zancudomyces culisetae]
MTAGTFNPFPRSGLAFSSGYTVHTRSSNVIICPGIAESAPTLLRSTGFKNRTCPTPYLPHMNPLTAWRLSDFGVNVVNEKSGTYEVGYLGLGVNLKSQVRLVPNCIGEDKVVRGKLICAECFPSKVLDLSIRLDDTCGVPKTSAGIVPNNPPPTADCVLLSPPNRLDVPNPVLVPACCCCCCCCCCPPNIPVVPVPVPSPPPPNIPPVPELAPNPVPNPVPVLVEPPNNPVDCVAPVVLPNIPPIAGFCPNSPPPPPAAVDCVLADVDPNIPVDCCSPVPSPVVVVVPPNNPVPAGFCPSPVAPPNPN